MAKNCRQTSKTFAAKTGRILKDGRSGKDLKSVAGNASARAGPGKKK